MVMEGTAMRDTAARSTVRAERAMGLALSWPAGESASAAGRQRWAEAARVAEKCGFDSIWLLADDRPDVGVRANPALIAATVAVSTDTIRVGVRSLAVQGHDALRVAEDWSVVDNLSNGRLELLSRTSEDGVAQLGDHYRTVRDLWEGKEVRRDGPDGEEHVLRTYPKPRQPCLPLWLPDTAGAPGLELAAELNAGLLIGDEDLAFDQLAARVRDVLKEFVPGRVSVLAGRPETLRDIRELYALGVAEVVCRLDVDAAGDRLLDSIAEIARGRPE